ncbi:MAG: AI-2E family transporter [Nocardioidaceae bacterium]|nr:MAG: AI-2E family transporter [Nocardioidaceae bacterium]
MVLLVGAALTITMAGVRAASGIISMVFLALILTITVHPVRAWLRRKGVPSIVTSVIMLVAVYLILIVVILMLVVSIGRLATLLPTYTPQIQDYIDRVGEWLAEQGVGQQQVDAVIDSFDVGSLVGIATDVLSTSLGIASDTFFLAVLLLFMAFDTTKTTQALAMLREHRPDFVDGLRAFAIGTRSYMAVSAGFGAIVAIIDAALLMVMGVPGAFVWGVLAFVTNFIPNIGFVIGVVPPALIGLLEGGPGLMIGVIVMYSVVNFVIQSVIQPRIVGDRVGLSATVTFLSLVFWAFILGPMGALLAVPATLLCRGLLIDADPASRWVLPLVSGKAQTPEEIEAGYQA